MHPNEPQQPDSQRSQRAQRLTVLELMILSVGVAVGVWLVAKDVTKTKAESSIPDFCWMYGTPLMAIYVTVALLAGGWLRRGRRRRWRSWREQFGLLLGLAWACTGLYVMYLFYGEPLRR